MIIIATASALILGVQAYLISSIGKTQDVAKANNLMLNALMQGRAGDAVKVKIPKLMEEPQSMKIPKVPTRVKKATRNVKWSDERRKLASERHKQYWAKRKAGQWKQPTTPPTEAQAASDA